MLALDVDGVLTDGGIIVHDNGSESKKFHVQDGAWIVIWRRLGLKTAIISGRHCGAVAHRAKELKIDYCYQNCHHKLEYLDKLVEVSGIPLEQTAYIGDDVADIPILRRVGFAAAVADALPQVKQAAHFTTTRAGGRGAVQEVIAHLLTRMGLMELALERYYQ